MTAHVWIVEVHEKGKWRACVSAHRKRRDAKREKKHSAAYFPYVRYRVRKYVRASK